MADSTLSEMRGLQPNSEMSIIGYTIAAFIFVAMIPLLPVVLLYVVIDWIAGVGRGDTTAR